MPPWARQHLARVAAMIGDGRVDVVLDHRGVLVWRGVRPGSADATLIELDAIEGGLRCQVPWRMIDEIEVSR